jgi:tetratricopeptide (TPR) repeat protein
MVALHDGKPVVKVIDFGVAKALHRKLTEKSLFTGRGTMVGTPQYMSPEQADMTGLDVDTRSDIYSLSVLLYELITGITPLDSEKLRTEGLLNLRRMICEEEPPRPSQRLTTAGEDLTTFAQLRSISPERLSREIKGDLDWISMKGLDKDRSRRYDTAKDLAADVRRALNHQPVMASPPSLVYRAKKFARRNRIQLTLAAAVFGISAVTIFGLLNNRQHRLSAARKDEARLTAAIIEANSALAAAAEDPNSSEHWTAASLMAGRIAKLFDESLATDITLKRAHSFIERFDKASHDRMFTSSMEELLVRHATKQSVDGLRIMEHEFRRILRNRGYDLDTLSPDDFATQLKMDHAPIKLTDALELWLTTRMRLGDESSHEITPDEVAQWSNAMSEADPNPLRTVIRSVIFRVEEPNTARLNRAVNECALSTMCARKLSWIAQAFEQAGDSERSNEIRDYALTLHSSDLMVNFEHAIRLMDQKRHDEAIRYFMRCTSIRPRVSGIWKKLAEAFRLNNELQRANKTMKTAIELEPNEAGSHLQLAEWLLQDQKPKQAIESAEMALELDRNLHKAFYLLGQANMQLQQYNQALFAFEKFQKLATENKKSSVEDWIISCHKKLESTR